MRLDRILTLQFVTQGKTASGAPTETWGGDVSDVWAKVQPESGREFYAAQAEQLVAYEMLVFTIRYRTDVRPGVARILYHGRTYNIRRVDELERNRWLELHADCKVA